MKPENLDSKHGLVSEIKILIVSLILLGSYFLWTFLGKHFLMTKYF